MAFLRNLFGKSSQQRKETTMTAANPWVLTCRHCGETFVIGENAFLVTDEDKYHALSEADAAVIFLGPPTRKPEMVMRWTRVPTEEEKTSEGQKVARLRAAISQGESRSWWCGKCYSQEPNKYPSP
jgi:hypothetical protein